MSRTPHEYAEELGAKLSDHPDAVEAICELAMIYKPTEDEEKDECGNLLTPCST